MWKTWVMVETRLIKAFQAYIHMKIKKVLSTSSTGIPPHFTMASDKSIPLRVSNHAIMVLVMVEGGKQPFLLQHPFVYEFAHSQISRGTSGHLAEQIISSSLDNIKISASSLSAMMADGWFHWNTDGDGQRPVHNEMFLLCPGTKLTGLIAVWIIYG